MSDEYRTKELLTDALNVYKHLKSHGYKRVRFVTQVMGNSKSNWGNYKPLIVIGFTTPTGKDKYIIFTSKFIVDSFDKKTTLYSSIRLGWFTDSGVETTKFNGLDEFKAHVIA